MESEKVKEIKKALEFNANEDIYVLPYVDDKGEQNIVNFNDILTLINELESENERLKVIVDIANERFYREKFIDEWRKEYQKELDKQGEGHIAGYPDFDLVYRLYFEQKDRIAELEKENESLYDSYHKGYKVGYEYGKQDALSSKQTAENLFNTIIQALEEKKDRIRAFYGVDESVGIDIAIKTVQELAKQSEVEIKE